MKNLEVAQMTTYIGIIERAERHGIEPEHRVFDSDKPLVQAAQEFAMSEAFGDGEFMWDDYEVTALTVYEVIGDAAHVDVTGIYKHAEDMNDAHERQEQEARDRREYERLRQKFAGS